MPGTSGQGIDALTVEMIGALYVKYLDSLRVVRDEQRELLSRGMTAQLDDIEAELTYLLIREIRPELVVEIGSLHGWSTTWILRALRDNDYGELLTMDLVPNAIGHVPASLIEDRWTFRRGDVRTLPADWVGTVDYLFLDAAHTARFARWYVNSIFPELRPGIQICVHDVFHRHRPWPHSEGAVVLDWLAGRNIDYLTAAVRAAPGVHGHLVGLRERLGLTGRIHSGTANPMIFFRN